MKRPQIGTRDVQPVFSIDEFFMGNHDTVNYIHGLNFKKSRSEEI